MFFIDRVYDRDTWKEETWNKLNGECVSAVWSPDSSFFYFACEEEALIRVIQFITKTEVSANGDRIKLVNKYVVRKSRS